MNTELYKTRLLDEKMTLETSLASIGRRNPHNPSDWEPIPSEVGMEADQNDQAENLESYAENTAILNDLEIRYNAVTSALSRIEDGTYGVCGVGGEEIETDRLTADPAATTCKIHLGA
jgi:RNA polymerase-binding transcription factor DksA